MNIGRPLGVHHEERRSGVVGDGGGQIALVLELVRRARQLLGPGGKGQARQLQVVDVGIGPEPLHDRAVRPALRPRPQDVPTEFAVVTAQPVFEFEGIASCDRPGPAVDGRRAVVGVDQRQLGLALEPRRIDAEVVAALRVGVLNDPGRRRGPHLGRNRLGEKAVALFAHPHQIVGAGAGDADGNGVGHRGQAVEVDLAERLAREHRQHPHQLAGDHQRVAGKGHHAFAPRPRLIAHPRVAVDVVGQVRRPLLGDQPDLEPAHRDAAVRAVDVRVEAGARLQLEHRLGLVEGPDPREGGAQVIDDDLDAALEHVADRPLPGERKGDIARQQSEPGLVAQVGLGLLLLDLHLPPAPLAVAPVGDVHAHTDQARRLARAVEQEAAARLEPPDAAVGAHDPVLEPVGRTALDRAGDGREDAFPIVGMDVPLKGVKGAGERAVGKSVHLLERGRPRDPVGAQVPLPGPHLGGVEHERQIGIGDRRVAGRVIRRVSVGHTRGEREGRRLRRSRRDARENYPQETTGRRYILQLSWPGTSGDGAEPGASACQCGMRHAPDRASASPSTRPPASRTGRRRSLACGVANGSQPVSLLRS